MPRMQHRVTLSAAERTALRTLLADNATPARTAKRAQALLLSDRAGPGWPDARVAMATSLSVRTVCRLRLAWTERGLAAVHPRGHSPGRPPLTDEQVARLVALRLSPAPAGRAGWSLRLLASRAVELHIVPTLSHETVRRTLKKTGCRSGASAAGSPPPATTPAMSNGWRMSSPSTGAPATRAIRSSVSTRPARR